jgi:RNA recognition motif-containing protein
MQGQGGRSKGCGIVEYASTEEARHAIASLHDTELQGRLIFVRQDKDDGRQPLTQPHYPPVLPNMGNMSASSF